MRAMTKYLVSKRASNLVGMEVGVYRGQHAELMLAALPQLTKLYLVDHWSDAASFDLPTPGPDAYQETIQRLSAFKKRIVLCRTRFEDLDTTNIERLDFCYIDASHDTNSVVHDIQKAMRLIKPGGVVGGHDGHFPEVLQALKICFPKAKIHSADPASGDDSFDWWVELPR